MENINDELMDLAEMPEVYEVFFQFDEDEPVKLAYVAGGATFSLTMEATETDEPTIVFRDGNNKQFKLFMKK